jgi:hypothetical protein
MPSVVSRRLHAKPPREGWVARTLRWARDRRDLAELDDRRLLDLGLTRTDVALGIPFALPKIAATERRNTTRTSGIRRLGWLDLRGWCLKLYSLERCAAGLRPEDLAAAGRAAQAALAEPRPAPVSGFALLGLPAENLIPAATLTLTAYWWEGADLYRSALLLGDPPRRAPNHGGWIGSVAELDLLAREARAWRTAVLEAATPSPAAYLTECCA